MDEITIRPMTRTDLPAVVAMLADDPLGATRERPDDLGPYERSLETISADPAQELVVAERAGVVVATLQLTVVPGLSRRGSTRAIIEAVRVAASERGRGLGAAMITWAVDRAAARGCALVQLTSDASRVDAHRFYERLGFEASHVGFKRAL